MEGEEGDALCGLALDSVMQKAAELEASLRDWKEHLAILGSAGTSEAHSLDSARHSPSPPSLVGRGGGGGGGEGGRGRGEELSRALLTQRRGPVWGPRLPGIS